MERWRKFVQLRLRRAACVAELLERILDGLPQLEVDAVKYSRVPRIGRCGKKDGEGQERQFNHGPATLRADDRLFGPQTL